MSITINRQNPGDVFLELGGGEHPVVHPRCLGGQDVHADIRACYLPDGRQTVDFTMDAEQIPWPVGSNEFDGLVSVFMLEHVSYARVPDVLREAFRVLKPGHKAVFALPNTEAQLKWVQTHPDGWDGKPPFESMSEVLYGTQDEHTARGHQSYWSPGIATLLFAQAGFEQVKVFPYGERATDMVVEAFKPPEKTSGSVVRMNLASESVPAMVNLTQEQWHEKVANWPEPHLELSGDLRHYAVPCGCPGPNGLTCIKPKGHPGKHAAETK